MAENKKQCLDMIMQIRKCIEGGTLKDYNNVFDVISNSYIFTGLMHFRSNIYEHAIDYQMAEFISAYAAKYPAEFSKLAPNVFQEYICIALMNEITDGSKTAFTVADMLLSASYANSYISDALFAAVICENDSFFDYFTERISSPSHYVTLEMLYDMFDNKKYRYLDKIYEGATKADILYPTNINTRMFLSENKSLRVDVFYELGIRYVKEIRDSENVTKAVSDMLHEGDILNDYLCCLPPTIYKDYGYSEYISTWRFMKEHDLKFKEISELAYSFFSAQNNLEGCKAIINEYLMPLFEDELTIDVFKISQAPGDVIRSFAGIFKIIDPGRVYLDFTGDNEQYQNMDQYLHINPLLSSGLNVLINDDFANSGCIQTILHSVKAMRYILERTNLPDEQLAVLINKCIEYKYIDTLNVIRQYMSSKFQQK